jgi:hypothetical protein
MFGLGIFIGMVLGASVGVVVTALCVASKKADKGVEYEE